MASPFVVRVAGNTVPAVIRRFAIDPENEKAIESIKERLWAKCYPDLPQPNSIDFCHADGMITMILNNNRLFFHKITLVQTTASHAHTVHRRGIRPSR